MIDRLLSFVAPHLCSGCSIEGVLLCDNCKYDISEEPFFGCVVCGRLVAVQGHVCSGCKVPYQRAWCVGERRDALLELIDQYKFYRAKEGHIHLADLLNVVLPVLPPETCLVPVPTLQSHVRVRGYDHMLLIARRLAHLRGLEVAQPVRRITHTKQVGASRSQRLKQAAQAFRCETALDDTRPYLILDDVITTGATVASVASALSRNGAQTIWVAALCRQPL